MKGASFVVVLTHSAFVLGKFTHNTTTSVQRYPKIKKWPSNIQVRDVDAEFQYYIVSGAGPLPTTPCSYLPWLNVCVAAMCSDGHVVGHVLEGRVCRGGGARKLEPVLEMHVLAAGPDPHPDVAGPVRVNR
jgi:hypothetical protein